MQQLAAAPAPTQCVLMSQSQHGKHSLLGLPQMAGTVTRDSESAVLLGASLTWDTAGLTVPQGLEAVPASQLLHVPPSLSPLTHVPILRNYDTPKLVFQNT